MNIGSNNTFSNVRLLVPAFTEPSCQSINDGSVRSVCLRAESRLDMAEVGTLHQTCQT